MHRGAGVHSSDNQLNLTENSCGDVLGGAAEVKGTDSLTVEAEVFGETLGDHEVEAVFLPDVHGEGVLSEVSCGVALVGTVEEGVESSLLEEDCELLPLSGGGVDSGGVVGAGMQKHDGPLFGFRKRFHHSLKVQSSGFGMEIGVCFNG